MQDDMGDRLKSLESVEAGRKCMPLLPICVRLDGKGFSKWTKGLRRPYDERLSTAMQETTKFLVEESNAIVGYTQSDEISLILYSDTHESQVYFDGKIQKLTSVLCSLATATFNKFAPLHLGEDCPGTAIFDCRVWNVPNQIEATNTILWREKDASKNSVSMSARHYYSHKELHGKTCAEMQELMWQKGVNWNDYPAFFKRGSFFLRRKSTRPFTTEELERIKEPYRSKVAGTVQERSDIVKIDMPSFVKVVNRVQVLFEGADPIVLNQE